MSMFLQDSNGNLVSFSEFCLSESIRPKPTQYGTDENASNGNIERKFGIYYTFIKTEDAYWSVSIRLDGEVAFSRRDDYSPDPMDYSDDRRSTRSALQVFNHVFYVLLEMFDKIKVNTMTVITFEGANPALGKVYDRLVKNKWFLASMEEKGFEYSGITNGKHVFKTKYGKGF